MTATLAIYDLDEVYANSLMKYINQKQNMPFKATAFTNKEALEEYLQDNILIFYWWITIYMMNIWNLKM